MNSFNGSISDKDDYTNIVSGSKEISKPYNQRYLYNSEKKESEMIKGVFDENHVNPRAKILQERVHAICFIKEKFEEKKVEVSLHVNPKFQELTASINSFFEKVQRSMSVCQTRNSKNQKEFIVDLKTVYQAASKDSAEYNLLQLDEKWGKKYPMVIKSWQQNWENLSTYFKYSAEVRRIIYTTNPIEGFHRGVRKYTKTKGSFTSENALFKLVFCAIKQITAKWNMPISNWALAISQLDIYFPDRLKFGR